ncbi:hypothetical protein VTL71DRAFT_6750 [Oculimacula yallundae]|uniref:Uncharacterized protein n=1 Tax=Oculimacula yallundae TaxID=86028 RepID=A0ABR4BXT4_9HELO
MSASKSKTSTSHLIGLARRKGEKNSANYNLELDPRFARCAPDEWNPALPPPSMKKKQKKDKAPATSSSSSSGKDKGKKKEGGFMGKLMAVFAKKKGKGKEKRKTGSRTG